MNKPLDTPRSPESPTFVFISHASDDAASAERLCAALESDGSRCWVAPRDIPPATSWPEAIAAGVKGSRAVVVLLTARSMNSPHLLREVQLAITNGVPVIPMRLDDTPLAAGLEYLLSTVQWINAAGDPPNLQAAKVRAAIERTPIDVGPPRAPPSRKAAWVVAVAAALAVIAAGFSAAGRPRTSTRPAPAPAPIPIRSEAASLPFGSLLQTVWTGVPPGGESTRPALLFEILAKRGGADGLVAVRDGDPLRSAVDLYVITARPTTPGHLYVFQIDSRGAVYWLFPKNVTCELSTGTNPVAPGRIDIPGGGRGLVLDEVAGDEHVCAVFTNAPWPELEERLNAAGKSGPAGRPLPPSLVAARSRGVAGTRPLAQDLTPVRVGERDLAAPAVPALLHEAGGSTLVIDRWFRHE